MIFEGNIQQLKFYLKHLKRDRGIIARRIEEIGPGQYRIDIQGVDTMKEVQKNTQEKIRIEKREYKGKEFIDVRTYYLDDSGEWKPTQKGVTFRPDRLNEVMKALKSLEE
jgi:hypothetical protein